MSKAIARQGAGLTVEEADAVRAYFETGGKVTVIGAEAQEPVAAPSQPRPCASGSRSQGPAQREVRRMGIHQALEWAFGAEGARLSYNDGTGAGLPAFGLEYLLMEQGQLGGRVDVSRGRSLPDDDAELIAVAVQCALSRSDAITVVNLARAGLTPWRGEDQPRLVPRNWVCGRGGVWRGKADDARVLGPEGWQPVRRTNRLGRVVSEPVLYTPCRWEVSASRIAATRRAYLDWFGHLLSVRAALEACDLRWIAITADMPPLRPWTKGA